MSLNWMILCSKLKNDLCKIVIKSQVVTEFNVTKSSLHCTWSDHNKTSLLARQQQFVQLQKHFDPFVNPCFAQQADDFTFCPATTVCPNLKILWPLCEQWLVVCPTSGDFTFCLATAMSETSKILWPLCEQWLVFCPTSGGVYAFPMCMCQQLMLNCTFWVA